MMKRLFSLALVLLCLLGCSSTAVVERNVVDLYYQKTSAELGAELGILGTEKRFYSGALPSFEALLSAYLQGPSDEGLISPFPSGLTVDYVGFDNNILTIHFNPIYDEVTGYQKTIMDACIINTMTQLDNVNSVVLETDASKETEDVPQIFSASDFILEDTGVAPEETVVRMYYSDVNGRYLVASDMTATIEDQDTIPALIMERLIEGPTESGQYRTVPEGTELRSITVDDDGLCTVDLSSEFLYNKPNTELMERIAIFSVVNSLTELKTIQQVLFLVEGESVDQYLYLNLSGPMVRDENILTTVRLDQGEVDATIYVAGLTEEILSSIPVGLSATTSGDLPEKLLVKLLRFEDQNGYENPLPSGVAIQKISQSMGICYVDFNQAFLQCSGDIHQETVAVGSIVATLTGISTVAGVVITIDGKSEGLEFFDLTETLYNQTQWYH